MDNVSLTDIMAISSEMSKKDVLIEQLRTENKDLRNELSAANSEIMRLNKQVEELLVEKERASTENAVFRTLFVLSREKVKMFFQSLNNFHMISICYTFLLKTLSDLTVQDVIKEINEITGIKDMPSIIQNKFEKDSKCVISNRDISDCDFNQ